MDLHIEACTAVTDCELSRSFLIVEAKSARFCSRSIAVFVSGFVDILNHGALTGADSTFFNKISGISISFLIIALSTN